MRAAIDSVLFSLLKAIAQDLSGRPYIDCVDCVIVSDLHIIDIESVEHFEKIVRICPRQLLDSVAEGIVEQVNQESCSQVWTQSVDVVYGHSKLARAPLADFFNRAIFSANGLGRLMNEDAKLGGTVVRLQSRLV